MWRAEITFILVDVCREREGGIYPTLGEFQKLFLYFGTRNLKYY